MPPNGLVGKKVNHKNLPEDDIWLPLLKKHFEYLLQCGEVRATRMMASFVDGVYLGQINDGGVNNDKLVDVVYLPISWGIGHATIT